MVWKAYTGFFCSNVLSGSVYIAGSVCGDWSLCVLILPMVRSYGPSNAKGGWFGDFGLGLCL